MFGEFLTRLVSVARLTHVRDWYTRLSSSSKSVSCSCIAAKMVWKAETKLLKMMERHCFRSVLLKPPACITRICFSTVDFPLSPAPVVASCQPQSCVVAIGVPTEQQQLHLAFLLPPVISNALFDLLVPSRLRVLRFLAKTHYPGGHTVTRRKLRGGMVAMEGRLRVASRMESLQACNAGGRASY